MTWAQLWRRVRREPAVAIGVVVALASAGVFGPSWAQLIPMIGAVLTRQLVSPAVASPGVEGREG